MNPIILIIEDDAVQQKLYKLLCARLGFESRIYGSAKEACLYLEQTSEWPRLVLLDCMLRGEHGLDFVPAIKDIAARRHSTLPVVAATANAFETDKLDCLKAGVDEYLCKPFTLEQFSQTIKRWQLVNMQAQSTVA